MKNTWYELRVVATLNEGVELPTHEAIGKALAQCGFQWFDGITLWEVKE